MNTRRASSHNKKDEGGWASPLAWLMRRSTVSEFASLSVQYNYTVIAVVEMLIPKGYGSDVPSWASSLLTSTVFAGSIVGMLMWGYLGDRIGRRRAFVLCLINIIVSALASSIFIFGDEDTLCVTIAFWRFTLGIGIGGVYPLSAADSYENEGAAKGDGPRDKQAVMRVAWTLFWQQPGQILVYLIALVILSWFGHRDYRAQFRIMMALGALPAILVLPAALLDEEESLDSQKRNHTTADMMSHLKKAVSVPALRDALTGTCVCWFLFDIYLYGVSLYSPEILDMIFGASDGLSENYWQNVLSISVTFPAALLSVWMLRTTQLRTLQLYGFGFSACVFLVIGVGWNAVSSDDTALFVMFLAVKFSNLFAAATTTFVLPSDLFPTEVRSSCHGVSAAAGKLGAFVGSFGFPYIYDWAGMAALFYMCFVISLLAIGVTLVYIPKSSVAKSLSPEHKSHSSTGSLENGNGGFADNATTASRTLPVSPQRSMTMSPYANDLVGPKCDEDTPLLS